ncbi:asparagine synthase (glutamine-hydrolysing) [Enhydrobacter aerosaccus]|uniref:asparagine synthase (glutamine-hydrolyzing) n=2 Tax=Enhydrobacter aerosaccus TaxID=225324 RepID=A0A1T4SYY5_9HYPH|nr:asparagine synthase (glutamine-hydrolysing) [Enhydrobacter aerosaccus]
MIVSLGRARQAAFLCRSDDTSTIDGEACSIEAYAERFWIVGRVRLDGRSDLKARLAAQGEDIETASDAMLCLRAYAAWGERFTDFISGDLAFAIWDGAKEHLLAVRDQLGKRSLFHARTGSTWLISDSLDWIADRLPTAVAFDDYWIADFLTVGFSQEVERTVYRDIHRLAPAHLLCLSDAGPSLRKYWRLEVEEPLYLPRAADYGDRYRELLSKAIADRLPSGRIGIAMSGGLDSTTMAACAVELCRDRSRIVAECEQYQELTESREGYYAGLVAQRLGIELQLVKADDLVYDPHWQSRALWHDEPTVYFVNAQNCRALYGQLAGWASVWFDGEGPDNALTFDRDAYFHWLWRRGSWGRLAGSALQYAWIKGAEGWRASLQRRLGRSAERPRAAVGSIPSWLSGDFVARCHLAERLRDLGQRPESSHPWHPEAIASFTSPIWARYFDDFRFYQSLAPCVWRHPYLDLRVLQFMLSVPPVPWAWKKRLVRVAMRGRLPDEVLYREKTALVGAGQAGLIRRHGLPEIASVSPLDSYIDWRALRADQLSDGEIDTAIASHALAHWFALRQQKHCSASVI